MALISETLNKIRTANNKIEIANLLNKTSGVPGMATITQILAEIYKKPMVPITPVQRNALNLVEQFASRYGVIRFINLQRTRVAIQLIARVLNSALINQGSFGMCGPAAVAVDAAANLPVQYVTFAIDLAENGTGTLGHRIITPVASILHYKLDETKGMPQADWIVLASLRDDPTNLQESFATETYGGTAGSELFAWMVKSGFQKVLHMSHITFANMVEAHPLGLLPPGITVGDKMKTLTTAAELTSSGWRLFMQAFMQLAKSIESYKQIEDMETMLPPGSLNETRTKQSNALNVENPGYFGTVFGAVKSVMGFSGGDVKHWTFVETLTINKLANTITISCCNHGMHYPAVTLPLDGFANKFLGFVAVTDYA